ncbi:MAG: hypothetical protein VR69_16785 [Peptococcaceae bacterium BRH_c4b]|nr:MAG: hypothetical protein VR69_16785 [Peptococcaceae bacterium BRH_c4b]
MKAQEGDFWRVKLKKVETLPVEQQTKLLQILQKKLAIPLQNPRQMLTIGTIRRSIRPMLLKPDEIATALFYFSDQTGAKRRPVLVVISEDYNVTPHYKLKNPLHLKF